MIVHTEDAEIARNAISSFPADAVVIGINGPPRKAAQDLPGSVIEIPWTDDYSDARNRVREHARGLYGDDCHHVWLDADEEAQGHLPPTTEFDIYATTVILDDGTRFARTFMARPWIAWEYPIHEVLGGMATALRLDLPPMTCTFRILSHLTGQRFRNRNTSHPKDLEILDRWLAADPTNSRALFYRAQTLKALGRYSEARDAYAKRLTDNSAEARYAALQLAYMTHRLNEDPLRDLVRAADLGHPCAWLDLGAFLHDEGFPRMAQTVLLRGMSFTPDPAEFAPPPAWQWHDELAQVTAKVGELRKAEDCLRRLLRDPDLPAEQAERIRHNLAEIRHARKDA